MSSSQGGTGADQETLRVMKLMRENQERVIKAKKDAEAEEEQEPTNEDLVEIANEQIQ